MSIASEITRLQTIKTNIRTALVNKGITSASSHNMADFATDISNITSGGATITVTYNSQFYNKTMTCTKGSTTYTKTTTSSGSTTFSVSEGGTWTITCNGVSRTVDVVLEYSTQMAITKTITIYGAVEDTITFTDATGSKTCTFEIGQSSKSQSITFIPDSTITFTSTVSKNPSNLSANFTKTITMTDSITSIYVMPDNVMYWYGYSNGVVAINSTMISYYTWSVPTFNTRNISQVSSTYTHCGVTAPIPSNTNTKIKGIIKANYPPSGAATQIGAYENLTSLRNYGSASLTQDSTIRFFEFTTSNSGGVILTDSFGGASSEIYALWAE